MKFKFIRIVIACFVITNIFCYGNDIKVKSNTKHEYRIYLQVPEDNNKYFEDNLGTIVFFTGPLLISPPISEFKLVGTTPMVIHPENEKFAIYIEGKNKIFNFDSSIKEIQVRGNKGIHDYFMPIFGVGLITSILTVVPGSVEFFTDSHDKNYAYTFGISAGISLVCSQIVRMSELRAVGQK